MLKHKLAGILSGLLIITTTSYVLLDTFVIPKSYQTVAASSSSSSASASTTSTSSLSSSSQASNSTIKVTEQTYKGTQVYVADITLDSIESLRSAFASNTFGKNVTAKTSTIASENNATLAINGDFYGAQENGIVIRNGEVYRTSVKSGTDVLCISKDGSFKIVSGSEIDVDQLVEDGIWQAFSFGPGLVVDGEIAVSSNEEVGKAMASNPRTAIGYISENHYVFVVSDGRTSESAGLSLSELATFMKNLGCTQAYNLDGGGSSTMYYNGSVINNPTTTGRISERSVSDIIYIQ